MLLSQTAALSTATYSLVTPLISSIIIYVQYLSCMQYKWSQELKAERAGAMRDW